MEFGGRERPTASFQDLGIQVNAGEQLVHSSASSLLDYLEAGQVIPGGSVLTSALRRIKQLQMEGPLIRINGHYLGAANGPQLVRVKTCGSAPRF